MYGFKHQPNVETPEWAILLSNYYWCIRNEGRNKVKRRRYYRYIAKEKLRLAESGIDQQLINAVCKYLVSFNVVSGNKLHQLMIAESVQLSFDFT
jgi:hypothetical protein